MNILFVSPEMSPFAKAGGLGDVIGSLPKHLINLGHQVSIMMPKYRSIDPKKIPMNLEIEKMPISFNGVNEEVGIFSHKSNSGFTVYFIESDKYFDILTPYGSIECDYLIADKRYILFQLAILRALKELNLRPDIIHCHDWEAALIPAYLKITLKDDRFYRDIKTILTVHNIGYQGVFPKEVLREAGFDQSYFIPDKLEYWGKFSFLKAGLLYADILTTVSPTHSQEIQTPEFGYGMDGVLRFRKKDLCGILNGIDYDYWDPAPDKDIPFNYDINDLSGKKKNKLSLQKENGFEVNEDIFLIGMISRLVSQKGFDILSEIIDDLVKLGVQFVLLAIGEVKYHEIFESFAKSYPKNISCHLLFDAKMAKRIYAGSDAFLMPSKYEPCGLGQLISMRYGTVPIVRKTGGLADTVEDYSPLHNTGNGVVFKDYHRDSLLEAIKRAELLFYEKKRWKNIIEENAKKDFSWEESARRYSELYENLVGFKKDRG